MFMQHEIAGAERAYAFTVGHGGAILARTLREAVEMEAQRLIDWLDDLEPDPDLEPYLAGCSDGMDDREGDTCDDEPSLAGQQADRWGTDLEQDDCDDEDSDHSGCGDAEGLIVEERGEVDLGATEDFNHTLAWASPAYHSPGVGCFITDGEPSLGWSENHGAGHYENQSNSPRDDREDDAGDNGEMDDDRELEPDAENEHARMLGGQGV